MHFRREPHRRHADLGRADRSRSSEAVELSDLPTSRGSGSGQLDRSEQQALPSAASEEGGNRGSLPLSPPLTWLSRFWGEHVCVVVGLDAFRDHLAIERTFLGYFRTSVSFAILGTLVTQLFFLQKADASFGYSTVGKPMSTVCFSISFGTVLLGALRSWRHQRAVLAGKALAGGQEIASLAVGSLAVFFVLFGLLLVVDVTKVIPTPD